MSHLAIDLGKIVFNFLTMQFLNGIGKASDILSSTTKFTLGKQNIIQNYKSYNRGTVTQMCKITNYVLNILVLANKGIDVWNSLDDKHKKNISHIQKKE